MIATIRGILTETRPLQVVVEVTGLGYEVNIPLTTMESLPSIGQEVLLYTLAVYREDSQALFGFHSREERDFFRLLVEKVSGIGPRLALSIMSRLSLPVLRSAIAQGDVGLLSKCPGIGKKTAERLVVELRDKVGLGSRPGNVAASSAELATPAGDSPFADAVAALMTLGYKPEDADKAVRKAQAKLESDATTEALIKAALQ